MQLSVSFMKERLCVFFQANHRGAIQLIPPLATFAKGLLGHTAFQGCEGFIDSRIYSVVLLPQPTLSFEEQHRAEEPFL